MNNPVYHYLHPLAAQFPLSDLLFSGSRIAATFVLSFEQIILFTQGSPNCLFDSHITAVSSYLNHQLVGLALYTQLEIYFISVIYH